MMDKKIPLFKKIASDLKKKILRGEYKAGMLMPSEKKLQAIFSVSRTTIRKAVDLLVYENFVIRKNGIGLYVQPKLTSQNILEMTGVIKSSSALIAQKKIKDFYIRKAGQFYGKLLNRKENELVYLIKLVQETPHMLTAETLILPLGLYSHLQTKDFQIVSILELINSGSLPLFKLEQELQLILSNQEQAKYLQTKKAAPIFKLSTLYYAEPSIPIAVGYRYENAALTKFIVDFN